MSDQRNGQAFGDTPEIRAEKDYYRFIGFYVLLAAFFVAASVFIKLGGWWMLVSIPTIMLWVLCMVAYMARRG